MIVFEWKLLNLKKKVLIWISDAVGNKRIVEGV